MFTRAPMKGTRNAPNSWDKASALLFCVCLSVFCGNRRVKNTELHVQVFQKAKKGKSHVTIYVHFCIYGEYHPLQKKERKKLVKNLTQNFKCAKLFTWIKKETTCKPILVEKNNPFLMLIMLHLNNRPVVNCDFLKEVMAIGCGLLL